MLGPWIRAPFARRALARLLVAQFQLVARVWLALSLLVGPGTGGAELGKDLLDAAAPLARLSLTAAGVVGGVAAMLPRPAVAQTASNIVLSQGGVVRVTVESSNTTCSAGDFGIESPPPSQVIFQDYSSQILRFADLGPFAAGTGLVFYITPATQGAVCGTGAFLSTDPTYARVSSIGTDAWRIAWEDHPGDPNDPPGGDFNDLVVRVERVGPATGVDVAGGQAFSPVIDGDLSADPVNLLIGSYSYTRTDLSIAGRGPSPAFARAYNGTDQRSNGMGPGWTHSYGMRLGAAADGSGSLALEGPQGRTDRYTRQTDGTFSPPPGVFTRLAQNADGTYTATLPDQATWTFDASGRLTAIADRYGNRSTVHYNTFGHMTSVDDPAGRGSLTFGYDATSGLLTSVTDWSGRAVRYAYDAQGRLHTVTDRENQVTIYAYDGTTSHLTTITDALGHVAVTNGYDAQGRVATQEDARGLTTGHQTTFVYLDNGDGTKTTRVTYPANSFDGSAQTTESTFNSQGWLIRRVARPVSGELDTTSFTYDTDGKRTSTTDPRGATTSYCYDADYSGAPVAGSRGNLTRVISPAPVQGGTPLVSVTRYDAKNNVVQAVAAKGVSNGSAVDCGTDLSTVINAQYATDLAYDASGILLQSVTRRFTDPDLGAQTAVSKIEYDAANPGRPSKTIPPRGNTASTPDYTFATTYTYGTGSSAGLLVSTADPLGRTTTFGYDAVGRRTSMVDPLGNASGGVAADHTTAWTYDNEDRVRFGRRAAPQAGGAALSTESRFDAVGNRVASIDANGQVTKYLYDERDSLQELQESPSAWTDPATTPSPLIRTVYSHDDLGNLTRVLRAAGDAANERATDYASDSLGRVRKETQYPSWPDTSTTLVTQTTYDADGNRATLVDPKGQTTTSTYDALNRLAGMSYSDGMTPSVTYTYDANGNRTSMRDGTGTTTYSLDELNRALSVSNPDGSGAKTVGYRYDLDGHRSKLIYPDGTAVTYSFDKASQMSGLTDWANHSVSYRYDPDGALNLQTNPNGTQAQMARDNARRLTQVWNQEGANTISRHTYTLDAVGNRTHVDEVLPEIGTPGPIASDPTTLLASAADPSAGSPDMLAASDPMVGFLFAQLIPATTSTPTSTPAATDTATATTVPATPTATTAPTATDATATPAPTTTGTAAPTPTPAATSTAPTPSPTPTATAAPSPSTTPTPTGTASVATPVSDDATALPLADESSVPGERALYRADVGLYDVELFGRGGNTGEATVRHASSGARLRLIPSGSTQSRSSDGRSAAATLPSSSVRWSVLPDRVLGRFILPARPSGDAVHFALDYRGVRWERSSTDAPTFLAHGPDGSVLFSLLPATAQDAAGTSGHASLQPGAPAGSVALDASFLAAASYPVTVEVTIGLGSVAPLTTATVTPSATAASAVPAPTAAPTVAPASSPAALEPGDDQVAAGYTFGALLLSPTIDDPWSWGNDWWGQLGDGTTGDGRHTPAQVPGLGRVVSISSTDTFFVAARPDGTVWGWGNGQSGALGPNYLSVGASGPVQIAGLDNVVAVAAGARHALALKADGTVWAWGDNEYGQLGLGDTSGTATCSDWRGSFACRPTPTQVPGLSGVVSVAAGWSHSLVVKSDGTVWAWGYNGFDQLGWSGAGGCPNSPCDSSTPVQSGTITTARQVGSKGYTSYALMSDGTVWTWGANLDGELGSGTSGGNRRNPAPVVSANGTGTLSGVVALGAGKSHALALKGDGSVWGWGDNDQGALGDGTLTNQPAPVQALGVSGATTVAAGDEHSLAITGTGGVLAWGYNAYGQLGDGTTTNQTSAESIAGPSEVTAATAGEWTSFVAAARQVSGGAAADATGPGVGPRLVRDAAGRLLLASTDAAGDVLANWSNDNGLTWQSATLALGTGHSGPAWTLSADGSLHVVAGGSGGIVYAKLAVARDASNNVTGVSVAGGPVALDTTAGAQSPTIVLDALGRPSVAWVLGGGSFEVRFLRADGDPTLAASWKSAQGDSASPDHLGTQTGSSLTGSASLLVMPAGSLPTPNDAALYLVWQDTATGAVWWSRAQRAGATYTAWSTPDRKAAASAGSAALSTAPDPQNAGIVLAWKVGTNAWSVVRKGTADDTDAADAVLGTSVPPMGDELSVGLDRGDLYAFYRTTAGTLAIRRYLPEQGWDAAETVLDPSTTDVYPTARLELGGGQADVAWVRQTGTGQEVRAARLPASRPVVDNLQAPAQAFDPTAGQQATITHTNLDNSSTQLSATVAVEDCSGTTVRTLVNGTQSLGSQSVSWDGKNDSGATVAPGTYQVHVKTTDQGGLQGQAKTPVRVAKRQLGTDYSYDRLYRLTNVASADMPELNTSYAYDPAGNRTSRSTCGETDTYAYDRADRIDSVSVNDGHRSVVVDDQVDANGNLVARGRDTFRYDQANRLVRSEVQQPTNYAYNGDGVRVQTNAGQGPYQTHVYDTAGGLPLLLDDGHRKYVYGAGGLAFAVEGNGTLEVYHTDGLGSVRAVTYPNGNVTQTYGTDAFGVANAALTQGTSDQSMQYAGQERDKETGFLYLRARMYDPSLGRFLQADPVRKSGSGATGWNRYVYVGDNPTDATDPSGLIVYFVRGVGAGGLSDEERQFVSELQDISGSGLGGQAVTGVEDIFTDAWLPNVGEVFISTANPAADVYASRLRSRVLKDLRNGNIATGEPINFVALSGGATVVFDTASLLSEAGIQVQNVVTIGGWVQGPKPSNVGTWTAIVSEADFVASHRVPDVWYWTVGRPQHEQYLSDAYRQDVLSDTVAALAPEP